MSWISNVTRSLLGSGRPNLHSKSNELYISSRRGMFSRANRKRFSASVSTFSTAASAVASTWPMQTSGERNRSMISGGWMGSKASVASWPAYFRMIFWPPGCSGKNFVKSYTLPWRMTQTSSMHRTRIGLNVSNHFSNRNIIRIMANIDDYL